MLARAVIHLPPPRDERRPERQANPAMRAAVEQAEQVAQTDSTVLLLGETGVGKERFAQLIHDRSPRGHRPMVRVNCAAIPSELIESELFGRERGAYTGALTKRAGRFELATGSTLFLDEIGELPAQAQVKLLRVIEDRVVERLGGSQPIRVDVRIIAATNRNLEEAVARGTFRDDLFYRLNVFPIVIPALRMRRDEIPGLVWYFVNEFATSMGRSIRSVSHDSMVRLQQYDWPGNIRELRNLVERAVIMSTGPHLSIPVPSPASPPAPGASVLLNDVIAAHIRATLEAVNWRVRGKGGAAERLGMKPSTLETRMTKLGVVRPRRRCVPGAANPSVLDAIGASRTWREVNG